MKTFYVLIQIPTVSLQFNDILEGTPTTVKDVNTLPRRCLLSTLGC